MALKPLDNPTRGEGASCSGRNESEREADATVRSRGGRARNREGEGRCGRQRWSRRPGGARRKRCRIDRSPHPVREAGRRAECGKTARSVRRGGGWRRGQGRRTEAHGESRGRATGPYRARASPRPYLRGRGGSTASPLPDRRGGLTLEPGALARADSRRAAFPRRDLFAVQFDDGSTTTGVM